MEEKKAYPVAVSALPKTKELVRHLSAKTGKKKYAIIAEAVTLWAKQNGYES